MSDNKDLTPEEIGAILDSYPEGGESSAEEVEDPVIPPFGTPDLRMCKKCGAKAYLRKGGCTNRGFIFKFIVLECFRSMFLGN